LGAFLLKVERMESFWLVGLAALGIAVVATIRLAQARKEIADLRKTLSDVKDEVARLQKQRDR
jgi:Zn-dependent alcohol dehydrogenase